MKQNTFITRNQSRLSEQEIQSILKHTVQYLIEFPDEFSDIDIEYWIQSLQENQALQIQLAEQIKSRFSAVNPTPENYIQTIQNTLRNLFQTY